MLASEFKQTREPKIQKFRGSTSSGALLLFKSWMQDIECAIKDHNLNNDEALQLIKEFNEGCAHDNINFYLEVTDKPSIDGLFENLRQVFSSGEDGQQMLAEFYSHIQNPKESVKEFGESLLQIARKIMMAKPEFKVDINNTLKARFADDLKDHYHQAMAREMIHSRPTLSYVAYKLEILKTLGPNVKPHSITTSKLETSNTESPPKKHKCKSELDQKINAAIEENWKLLKCLSAFDPKTTTNTVINVVQGNYSSSKPAGFTTKQFKPSQFYGKPREPQLVPGTDGSLKPETDCNYYKDLGHLKYNCPKLCRSSKLQQNKKRKLGRARSGDPRPGPSSLQKPDHSKFIAKSSYTTQDLDLLCKEISCKIISDNNKIDIMQQAVAPCPEIIMSIKGKPTRSLLDSGSDIEHRLLPSSGSYNNLHNLFSLRGIEEGHVPLSKHFECDIEVGGQLVHHVDILVKKDKIPLVDSKGRKANTPALLSSNLIRIVVNEFCETFGEECLQLFECPRGISPLWFSALCLYYYTHIHKKSGVGASSVQSNYPSKDKDENSNNGQPKHNQEQGQSSNQAKLEKDSSKSKNTQTGKGKQHDKKLNTLGRYAG